MTTQKTRERVFPPYSPQHDRSQDHSAAPSTHVAPARSEAWADPDLAQIDALIAASQQSSWQNALDEVAVTHPFFAKRMRNTGLGNWHALLLRNPDESALDVGCGFGSLALGTAEYYRLAVGVDALSRRVRYGALRARQDRRAASAFVQGTGLTLPFRNGSFDLVTLNGVLEWAAHHAQGEPSSLQRSFIAEMRRVLAPDGTLAVAIENRYAMETLMGMHDTHTNTRLVPALPRPLAGAVMRATKREEYRTYLYSRRGYQQLFASAGFGQTAVLDLVSSYNDYDFVVKPTDVATYRFLWEQDYVRTFYRRAGAARRLALRFSPSLLGATSYAYLILGGAVKTVLDANHPVWADVRARDVPVGPHRFACKGQNPGVMSIATHAGTRIVSIVSLLGPATGIDGCDPIAQLPERLRECVAASATATAEWTTNGVRVAGYRVI